MKDLEKIYEEFHELYFDIAHKEFGDVHFVYLVTESLHALREAIEYKNSKLRGETPQLTRGSGKEG